MLFKNANIFVNGRFQHGSFRVENGRFTEILTTVPTEDGIDLNNQYVIPGLVDVHNHGNSGADFSDGDYDGLVKMARYLAQNGVTSFAPASMTLPYDVLETAYKTAVRLRNEQLEGCARLMGIHMEGPFFSEKKKGAQNGAYLRLPDFAAFKRLYDASEGLIRIADVAAELPGAVEFAEKASKLCTVSIAHSDCTYEEASAVFDAGASHLRRPAHPPKRGANGIQALPRPDLPHFRRAPLLRDAGRAVYPRRAECVPIWRRCEAGRRHARGLRDKSLRLHEKGCRVWHSERAGDFVRDAYSCEGAWLRERDWLHRGRKACGFCDLR